MSDARTLGRRIQRTYLWCVPWAGYLALLTVAFSLAMPAILTGWVLILVWQIVAVGALDAGIQQARRSPWALGWALAPLLLFTTQSWAGAELALANALIELTIVEVAALIVMLVTVMVLHDEEGKEMAWPGIIVMGIFIGFFLWAFVGAWRVLNPEPGWLRIGALAAAFATQCAVDWRWLRPLANGDLAIDDPLSGDQGMKLIVGQLVLWLLAPVPFALLR